MNWVLFVLCGWVAFGLQLGLAPMLGAGSGEVAPSFVIPLMVFVALHAQARTAIWAALALGVVVDLAAPNSNPAGNVFQVIGPNALGFALAAQLVLSLRGMVLSRNVLTPIVLNLVASAVAGVVVVAIYSVRSAYPDPIHWEPGRELLTALGSAVYTAIAGIPVTLVLVALAPWFGFPQHQAHMHTGPARAYKR